MGSKRLHMGGPVHGPATPCLTHFHCFPWPSVWEGNRLRGKMEREIRAEVKRENRKAGRKNPSKRCNCKVMTGWWKGISREEGSVHLLPSLLCCVIRKKPKEPFCWELWHPPLSRKEGERLK